MTGVAVDEAPTEVVALAEALPMTEVCMPPTSTVRESEVVVV